MQHLKLSKATLIISHEANLGIAYAAAREVGLSSERVIILEDQDKSPSMEKVVRESATVEQLIESGIRTKLAVSGPRLAKGEGKTQVAFYNSSSGTTGVPKVKIGYKSESQSIDFFCLDHQDPTLFSHC